MSPGRTATAVAFALLTLGAAWCALTRYSSLYPVPDPIPPAYTSIIRTTLAGGLAAESTAARAAVPAAASSWLVEAVRRDSGLVRAWTREPHWARLAHSAETTIIFWATRAAEGRCTGSGDLTAAFVGTTRSPRLVRLSSHCLPVAPITFDLPR